MRRETAAPKPWLAVVLAVDTANRSGWSTRVSGEQREFGEADSYDIAALKQIIRWACRLAVAAGGLPLVLVLEAHPWVGSRRTAEGLRAARERWLVAWRDEGMPEGKVVLVTPSEWRRAVLGRDWVRRPREEVRQQEQLVAAAMVGEADLGGDEAAAILIGCWAAQAQRVGAKIGGRAIAASMRAWREEPSAKFSVARARTKRMGGGRHD